MQPTILKCDISYVYGLLDPNCEIIRYVGQSVSPKERLRCHLNENKNTHKGNWLKSLSSQNLKPELKIISCVPLERICEEEQFWISYYLEEFGLKLTNFIKKGQKYNKTNYHQYLKNKNKTIGVSFNSRSNCWEAHINLYGTRHYLGSSKTKLIVQKVYDSVARFYFFDAVTNFDGVTCWDLEKAKNYLKEINRKVKYGTKYQYVRFDKNTGKFNVEVYNEAISDQEYISCFDKEDDAVKARDSYCKYIGQPTIRYHTVEAKSKEQIQEENNPTPEKKERLFEGISQKEYIRQSTGKVGVTQDKRTGRWVPQIYVDGKRVTVGSFEKLYSAQHVYDSLAQYYLEDPVLNFAPKFSKPMSVEQAKQFAHLLNTGKKYLGVKQNKTGNWEVNISLERKKHRVGTYKDLNYALYIYDALANHYNKKSNQTTKDKLSLEQAKQLIKK